MVSACAHNIQNVSRAPKNCEEVKLIVTKDRKKGFLQICGSDNKYVFFDVYSFKFSEGVRIVTEEEYNLILTLYGR